MEKRKAKNIVLPHSKAKLDLYSSYLEKYFAILGLAKGIPNQFVRHFLWDWSI